MMTAAVYIRKSRENDDKPSYRLTVQREQLPSYAQTQGWSVAVYDDGHASAARGKASQLPERSRLEADIRSGLIQVVLVIELSRLSRDESMQDYVAWLTLCADHRVKLATMTRTLDPGQHSDWMLLLMEGGFSSVEMKVLAGRMAEGRREAYLAGKWLGGTCPPPYRYDKGEGRPVVDPDLLADCERVWTMAESMSAKAIAERRGQAEITIRRMIADDRLLLYQGLRIDPETGKAITCDWQPVMTATRAEVIRTSRRTRKTNTVRRDAAGLLSALGIMYCGYCGKTVKSWTNSKIRRDGTRLDYYACVTKNRAGACPRSRMIDHHTVDCKVLRNLTSTLAQGELLAKWWRRSQAEKRAADNSGEILAELQIWEQKKRNLVEAITAGILELGDAREQMADIKNRLASLREQLDQQSVITAKEPDWLTMQLTADEFEHLDFTERRQVLKDTIERVTIYNTYAMVKYLFPRAESGTCDARINFSERVATTTNRKNSTSTQHAAITNKSRQKR